ncbi:MAG: hypothetical protein IBJ18_01525 [Phycisphaerales bacterium]|nr:hypothetical protein [Phycisphaerales bacterium]
MPALTSPARTMNRVALLSIALSLVLAAGTSAQTVPPSAPTKPSEPLTKLPTPPSPPSAPKDPQNPKGEGFNTAVIEPGAEPRRVVKFQTKPGVAGRWKLSQSAKITQIVPAMPPTENPEMTVSIFAEGIPADRNGDQTLMLSFDNAQMSKNDQLDAQAKMLTEALLRSVNGLKAEMVSVESGRVRRTRMLNPEKAGGMGASMVGGLEEILTQFSARFPEVPVGVGSKWFVVGESVTALAVVKTDIMAEYELTKLTDDSATLKVKIEGFAPAQDLPGQPGPDGKPARIESQTISATGELEVSFSRALATRGQIEETLDLAMTSAGQSIVQRVVTTRKLDQAPEPAPVPAPATPATTAAPSSPPSQPTQPPQPSTKPENPPQQP